MSIERTIKVTGTGSVSLKPDLTRLNITVRGTYKEYADTLKHSAEDTEALKDALEKLGFKRENLKTTSFNVDTRYEGYNDKNGNWRQRFMGYEFMHMLKLEFEPDNDLLGKTLYALAHSPVTPEFNVGYTVKDREAAKNLLIGKAVEDAVTKAQVLTKAANVSLGQILNIDYSFGDSAFEVMPMRMAPSQKASACEEDACCGGYDMDVSPDDIRVTDTVTVVWEII